MRRETDGHVRLRTIAREWGRIGCIGFGGPPTHIALLRKLCVEQRAWLSAGEFEDAIASTNLLPGPASTQLAIFCAWRLRGPIGGILGGICFILPGLVVILGLSAVFLAADPPRWVLGAAAGAGAAVPVVAVHAGVGLMPASWRRAGERRANKARWLLYLVAGAAAAATVGARLVLVLIVCGTIEVIVRRRSGPTAPRRSAVVLAPLGTSSVAVGGLAALAWVAFKVGALSYGGGFVIIPLMQHDAVVAYHWLTGSQFLNAVALGQITPGPVVLTVAVVGYAAAGLGGGLLAVLIAFTPSFVFVLAGGRHFSRLRSSPGVQAFLSGAGPASIGAITGAAIPLALELNHVWQLAILALAAVWLLGLRKNTVIALVGAGVLGMIAALAGAALR